MSTIKIKVNKNKFVLIITPQGSFIFKKSVLQILGSLLFVSGEGTSTY